MSGEFLANRRILRRFLNKVECGFYTVFHSFRGMIGIILRNPHGSYILKTERRF